MKKGWTKKRWLTIILHAAFWLLLFSLPFLLRPEAAQNRPANRGGEEMGVSIYYVVNNLCWIFFFYLNALVIIPKVLYRYKIGWFALAQLLLFGCYLIIGWFNHRFFSSGKELNINIHIFFTLIVFTFMLASSSAYQLIVDRTEADKLIKEKENENLKTELSLLRSQVSPHFMFNVLNNMVALARKGSDLLEPSLIKLSSLMRYMLYETDGEKMSLEKEIDYLQSYIDLQQQRFGKNVEVVVDFTQVNMQEEIEPMLLIPFVENAFKHGTGFIEQAKIEIVLTITDKNLRFLVKNRYNEGGHEVKDGTSGIGLTNVRRRLELLYGKKHLLQIEKSNGWFITDLQLQLT